MSKNALLNRSGVPALAPPLARQKPVQQLSISTKLLRMMKITAALLLIACLHVSASGLSQAITIKGKDMPFENVLSVVKKQSGYVAIYNKAAIRKSSPVTIDVENMALPQFLELLLRSQPLTFRIEEQTIFLFEKKGIKDMALSLHKTVSLLTISGIVTDQDGKPLGGASVRISGKNQGVNTDNAGKFSLQTDQQEGILIVSYVGYENKSMPFTSTTINFNIRLEARQSEMDKVVVNAGYYTVRGRERTGNIAKVQNETIARQPVTNPLAALSGRVPGLEITQSGGAAGAHFKVRLRGQNSIGSGNEPLFIIDGVPFNTKSLGNGNLNSHLPPSDSQHGVHPLNTISPSDILSIEVLKDADATAIYGSRGANGVILINTKKGKPGKTKFQLNSSYGQSKVARFNDLLNRDQYLEMRRESFANSNQTPGTSDLDMNGAWIAGDADLQKEMFGGTASNFQTQATISGGNQQTQFLVKGGFHRETTVYPADFFYNRISGLANLNHKSDDGKFNLQLSLSYNTDDNNANSIDIVRKAVNLSPMVPKLYAADGGLNWENNSFENPLRQLAEKYNAKTRMLNTNGMLSYKIFNDLEAKVNLGYSNFQIDQTKIDPVASKNPAWPSATPEGSMAWFNQSSRESWIIEPQLQYSIGISKGKLQALVGSSFQRETSNSLIQYGFGYPSDALIYNLQAAKNKFIHSGDKALYSYAAVFGRLNYNWDGKYIVNLTGRRDGSSRFAPGRQFANFGALGTAWIFSDESIIKNALPFLSFGKLRASYGITGNDQVNNYEFLEKYGVLTGGYDGVNGMTAENLYNNNFRWETNKKLEIGLELSFLNDNINLGVSWYLNRSGNQLVGKPLPGITGFASVMYNLPALVQNKGLEIELNTTNISNRKFKWSSGFNIAAPKNTLIAYPNLASSPHASMLMIGESISMVRLYNYTGVNPQTGLFTVEDYTKDGLYNIADRYIARNLLPEYFGGIQNTFQYGNWKLDIFFQFTKQSLRSPIYYSSKAGMFNLNQPVAVMDRWQKPGDIASYQRFGTQTDTEAITAFNLYNQSTGSVVDGSYIKLRNASVTYQLPPLGKIGWDGMVYLQGQNLLTITSYGGADPESGYGYLPPLRTITVGFQMNF